MAKTAYVNAANYDRDTIDSAVAKLFDDLGGIENLVPQGSKVFVKVNLVRDMPPEQAGTTHPSVVIAVVKLLQQKCNAEVTVGDSSGGAYTKGYMNSVYRKCRMTDVAEETGCRLNEDFDFAETDIGGEKLKSIAITDSFLKADVVINVGKLKSHSFTGYSGAVKNFYGLLPGLVKVEGHSRFPAITDFCDVLIDIERFAAKKTVLHMLDAVIGMEGAGPTNGKPRYIGKIFGSTDAYLCDVAAVSVFDDPTKQPLLKRAIERGVLSEQAIAEMDGLLKKISSAYIADFDRVEVLTDSSFLNLPKWVQKLAKKHLTQKVSMKKGVCRLCGKCRDHCPAQAITLAKKVAKVDQKKCIRCFCCQELCPFDAVKLNKPLLYRIVRRLSHTSGKTDK